MKKQTESVKAEEIAAIITALEKEIASEEMNHNDVDSIKEKIYNLKKKSGLFKEELNSPSTVPPYNFDHTC